MQSPPQVREIQGDSKAGRVVSLEKGPKSTVPEDGKHGRSAEVKQGQPEVEIDRQVHGDETSLRSSQEVKSTYQGQD